MLIVRMDRPAAVEPYLKVLATLRDTPSGYRRRRRRDATRRAPAAARRLATGRVGEVGIPTDYIYERSRYPSVASTQVRSRLWNYSDSTSENLRVRVSVACVHRCPHAARDAWRCVVAAHTCRLARIASRPTSTSSNLRARLRGQPSMLHSRAAARSLGGAGGVGGRARTPTSL
jgi:hypothetical protein